MTTITLQGKPLQIAGPLPKVGSQAPDFTLTKMDLTDIQLKDCLGKTTVLSIFPSVDTSVCALGMKHFNEMVNQLDNTILLCVSADLPFAQKRFCGAENLTKIIPVSVFRHPEFGVNYGVLIKEGPVKGLLCRAVIVLDEKSNVIYTQLVPELSSEPDYTAVLAAIKK